MALTQVSTDGVKNDAISHNKIPANAVQASELADNAVDTAAIADDAVTGAKIATNAVGLAALADNAVDTAAIANNAVTQQKIAADAVQGTIIANNAITTAKIANDAVTVDKLANPAVNTVALYDNAVTTAKILDANVTTAKIADGAVTNAKLDTNAVTNAKIGPQAVTLSRIENGTSSNDGKFLRANNGASPTFETVNTDLVSDTSPQLGGNLDTNNNSILLNDSNGTTNRLLLGTGSDMRIFHDGSASRIDDLNGTDIEIRANDIRLQSNANVGAKSALNCNANAAVELFYNDVKQVETTENGIKLAKGCIRGQGGSKVIFGGTLNPSQDVNWNFSFGTNDNGYNQGYVFNIKFYVNHWNTGNWYKYIESIVGGRGNVTGLNRLDLINNLGTGSNSWSSGHLDYSTSLSGGTRDGNNVSLFTVTYDADNTPAYTSGYYLEVNYGGQIGTISIT